MSSAPKIHETDVSALGIPELQRLRIAVDARINELEKKQREAAFKAIDDLARHHGLSKDELAARFGAGRNSHRRSGKARYRNPADPSQHWNGHGRRPQWVEQHLARGGTLAELEMKPTR